MMLQTYDYFHSEIDQRLVFMQDLEQLFTAIDFDTLSNLNNKIKETEDAQQGYQLICDQVRSLLSSLLDFNDLSILAE